MNYDGTYTYGTGPKGTYREQTSEVGSFPANAWGLQDMHGNVWEWCLDSWHDNDDGAPTDGTPRGSAGGQGERLLRGGSWHHSPWFCRCGCRVRGPQVSRSFIIGFRLCSHPPGRSS